MAKELTLKTKVEKYKESVKKAEEWLISIQNPDGSMNPVEKGPLSYYKVPRGFAIAGHLKEANNLLDWAKREIFTEEGDFKATRKAFHYHHYTYSSAWFVWVAQLLGRFDVSYPGMDYLRRFRNPQTSGYCSEAIYSRENNNEQDLLSISFNSFVGLHLGLVEEAKQAAELVSRILEQQPEINKELWLRVDEDGKLITRVRDGCDEPRFYVLEIKSPQQYYYYLGATMIFLTKLYTITANKRELELADAIFNICMACHEDVFLTDGTGKVGLGSAYLYKVTGEEKYAKAAIRSCDFLVSDQQQDGYWERGGQPTASSTAEFLVWLSEIGTILENGTQRTN